MKFPQIYALLFCAGLAVSIAPVSGQVPTPPAGATATAVAPTSAFMGPRMTCLQGDYNFGKVMEGTLVKHVFVVSNSGDANLIISSVVPGCHCTTAGDWTHNVAPGHTGTIAIQLNSGGMHGDVVRNITVTSTDRIAPRQTLYLRGSVWKAVEISPQFAYLNLMPDSISNTSTVVHIKSETDAPLTLSKPTSSNPAFKAELKTIIPGKEFEVTVTAHAPLAPGNNSGTVSLKTSLANMPEINITTVAIVQPVINVQPSLIFLPTQLPGPKTNTVTITDNSNKPLNLSDAAYCCDKAVSVQIVPVAPGRVYHLMAVFPSGFHLGTNQETQITLKTDNPNHPLIVVPIRQYYPRLQRPRPIGVNPPMPIPGQMAKHP